jgi:hypothetical protein
MERASSKGKVVRLIYTNEVYIHVYMVYRSLCSFTLVYVHFSAGDLN